MNSWEKYFLAGKRVGCPKDQMDRFQAGDVIFRSGSLRPARQRGCATVRTGRRPSATVGRGAAGNRIGCWARWARTIASVCQG